MRKASARSGRPASSCYCRCVARGHRDRLRGSGLLRPRHPVPRTRVRGDRGHGVRPVPPCVHGAHARLDRLEVPSARALRDDHRVELFKLAGGLLLAYYVGRATLLYGTIGTVVGLSYSCGSRAGCSPGRRGAWRQALDPPDRSVAERLSREASCRPIRPRRTAGDHRPMAVAGHPVRLRGRTSRGYRSDALVRERQSGWRARTRAPPPAPPSCCDSCTRTPPASSRPRASVRSRRPRTPGSPRSTSPRRPRAPRT